MLRRVSFAKWNPGTKILFFSRRYNNLVIVSRNTDDKILGLQNTTPILRRQPLSKVLKGPQYYYYY